jgi:hypothetical protein
MCTGSRAKAAIDASPEIDGRDAGSIAVPGGLDAEITVVGFGDFDEAMGHRDVLGMIDARRVDRRENNYVVRRLGSVCDEWHGSIPLVNEDQSAKKYL